jgi:hypothetical protein
MKDREAHVVSEGSCLLAGVGACEQAFIDYTAFMVLHVCPLHALLIHSHEHVFAMATLSFFK